MNFRANLARWSTLGSVLMVIVVAGGCSFRKVAPSPSPNMRSPRPTSLPSRRAFGSHLFAIENLDMVTASAGWAVTNRGIWHTSSGGRTWRWVTPLGVTQSPVVILPQAFEAMGPQRAWLAAGDSLFFTDSGGAKWISRSLPKPPIGPLVGAQPDFLSKQQGYVVLDEGGGTSQFHYSLWWTANGGRTWTLVSSAFPQTPAGIAFRSARNGWGVPNNPLASRPELLVTHSGGRQWQQIALPLPPTLPTPFRPPQVFTGLPHWFSPTTGWTVVTYVGVAKILYWSHDGGMHWTATQPVLNNPIAMAMVTPTVGWALLRGGKVLQTRDGGNSWSSLPTPPGTQVVEFVNPDHGWLVTCPTPQGASSPPRCSLWETVDGGVHWHMLPVQSGN